MRDGVRNALIGLAAVGVLATGCSHVALRGSDLDRVNHPAFVSRIVEGAGPESHVFEDDSSYDAKLRSLSEPEADRRLRLKLVRAITRFEISDRLRADTLAFLPHEEPWTHTVPPASVASALESFLVEEVPAHAPDYRLLEPLGADAVVEFVVTGYGMRSDDGKAGAFVKGYGRMFRLSDGEEIWRESFSRDALDEGMKPLDPFWVGKRPELFRSQIDALLDETARQFAKELSPEHHRHVAAPQASGTGELNGPGDDVHKAGTQQAPRPPPPPPDDELPPPDSAAP